MIGIDLTRISRFKKMKNSTINKFLSPNEKVEFETLEEDKRPNFLATRWALKEAIFKADNQYQNFNQIDIFKSEVGRYSFLDFELSTSNEDDYVIAIAKK
ncbi:4'-phosphopantetheinyl transferase superfamily protein [[Mycoplasma] anseris]|uniref:ACP synthase n=1 Tax=[Mycoplasma] anseris TaxID=92400 RepID=A0A2Z4NCU8_9BACT|nr:4'-phosphopantetheinyl transferase superfamily protein [[Mycoplasma] anseris]AWX69379.1 ACP synthase [[Mycoplasma] anseris]